MRDSAKGGRGFPATAVCNGVQLLYRLLLDRCCRPAQAAFAAWRERSPYAALPGARGAAVALHRAYGIPAGVEDLPQVLFALHTYVAFVAKLATWEQLAVVRGMAGLASPRSSDAWATLLAQWEEGQFMGLDLQGALEPDVFGWPISCWNPVLAELVPGLAQVVARQWPPCQRVPATNPGSGQIEDRLAWLYQALVPRPVRHALGEYYTPAWLVRQVLDAAGYPALGRRLLDPTCGTGAFLIEAIGRLRLMGRSAQFHGSSAVEPTWQQILKAVAGMDANPLAIVLARLNCLAALGELLPAHGQVILPMALADAVFQSPLPAQLYDYVVGNPPWIAWDYLPEAYRRGAQPLWRRYGLFSLSAREARHGGSKKDLAMLVVYVAAERYLRPGGRLAMLVPQTVFQSRGAGDGFRRFRLGADGQPLAVVEVHDLAELRPFDAANRTAAIVLEKGRPTAYPVPYVRWVRSPVRSALRAGHSPDGRTASALTAFASAAGECQRPSAGPGPLEDDRRVFLEAWPVDPRRPRSPWVLWPEAWGPHKNGHPLESLVGPSDYRAHLGANTGGANGVYWMTLVEADAADPPPAGQGHASPAALGPHARAANQALPQTVLVRNLAHCGKHRVQAVEQRIEAELLFPLLRWGDIQRFRANPRAYLLLVQDAERRSGIDEQILRSRYPRAYAYLAGFRGLLESRAAYRRYQGRGPFYAMYDVGPYTLAAYKVVWRRMDRQIRAAVVGPQHHPLLGRRPVVPQETCVLVPCRSAEEAHYVCALLNSAVVGFLAQAHGVQGGKGFGSPGMLDFLNVRRFDRQQAEHRALAARSRQAHCKAAQGEYDSRIAAEIDRLAGRLYGLDALQVARMAEAYHSSASRL